MKCCELQAAGLTAPLIWRGGRQMAEKLSSSRHELYQRSCYLFSNYPITIPVSIQIPIEQMSSADRHSILTEIKVLSMLHHPNVIEYYENFLQDKSMIIVMEYAAGGTLFDLIETRKKEGKHLEEDELAHLFAQGNIKNVKHSLF